MNSGRVEPSTITTTSLGPAIESMSTVAEDVPLGQGHEQVARPDDLVDPRDALDAVGQRGHGLGPAQPIDFA